jgi:hypothetical protein
VVIDIVPIGISETKKDPRGNSNVPGDPVKVTVLPVLKLSEPNISVRSSIKYEKLKEVAWVISGEPHAKTKTAIDINLEKFIPFMNDLL